MTAISIVRPYPASLTPVMGTLLAWLETADLQAVRLPSQEEVLLVDGKLVPGVFAPVQVVINCARLGKRSLEAAIESLRGQAV